MEPQYNESKICRKSAYGPPKLGMFAVEPPPEYSMDWQKCREQFSTRFTEYQPGLYFCHRPNEGHRVASFLSKTEEIIGFANFLHSYTPSIYRFTDCDNILWIDVSRFWMKQEITRQLLTILLRCGMSYEPEMDNYEDALWTVDALGNRHAADTQMAVTRFLFGFTKFNEDPEVIGYSGKIGWVTIFRNANEQIVRKLLVKPDGENDNFNLIGLGKVWTS
jgi:hypothetical protein